MEQTTCPVTNKLVMNNCEILINFGYGSSYDMKRFKFTPVSDKVGEHVLNTIQRMLPEGKQVTDEEFFTNGTEWLHQGGFSELDCL